MIDHVSTRKLGGGSELFSPMLDRMHRPTIEGSTEDEVTVAPQRSMSDPSARATAQSACAPS